MFSPLEQFLVLNLFSFYACFIDLSVTNNTVMVLLGLTLFYFISTSLHTLGKFVISSKWQLLIEEIYAVCIELVYDTLGLKGEMFFPVIFSAFLIILISNILGLIPYSFSITSHLVSALTLSYMLFIGVVAIGIHYHGFNLVSLFLPAGTSLALSFLLIPVEFLSYFFKPVSLGVRLFANLMAGHTLLKVIISFSWALLGAGGILLGAYLLPLAAIVILFVLETAVSAIQSYVFTILITIYLNDVVSLGH